MSYRLTLTGPRAFVLALGILSAGLPALSAQTISFDLQADLLQTATTGNAMPAGGLVMLLADTSGDGFATPGTPGIGSGTGDVTANASLFDGVDDLILWRGDLSASGLDGVLAESFSLAPGTYGSAAWDVGDALALAWFPDLDLSSLTFAGTYGLYSETASPVATSEPWTTPASGTSGYALHAFSMNSAALPTGPGTGSLAAGNLAATVPEPAAYGTLMGVSVLALAWLKLRRR